MRRTYASASFGSKMEDYIRGKDELIVSRAVIVSRHIVGMIISKLGPDCD